MSMITTLYTHLHPPYRRQERHCTSTHLTLNRSPFSCCVQIASSRDSVVITWVPVDLSRDRCQGGKFSWRWRFWLCARLWPDRSPALTTHWLFSGIVKERGSVVEHSNRHTSPKTLSRRKHKDCTLCNQQRKEQLKRQTSRVSSDLLVVRV